MRFSAVPLYALTAFVGRSVQAQAASGAAMTRRQLFWPAPFTHHRFRQRFLCGEVGKCQQELPVPRRATFGYVASIGSCAVIPRARRLSHGCWVSASHR